MKLRSVLVLVAAVLALACAAKKPPIVELPTPVVTEGGAPVFGISTVPRLVPAPGLRDYIEAADAVNGAGARASFESATWSDLDSAAGLAKLTDSLNSAGKRGYTVLLTIKVLDTTVRVTPADLSALAFDASAVKQRFHALIDTLAPSLGAVRYLSIGNEVDVYLGSHPATLDAYARFYADAVSYVHTRLPGVLVGVTSTYSGVSGMSVLNAHSDVVVMTYYPLGPKFAPRPPSTARVDVPKMLDIAGTKPLVLQEVGYPSATRLSSSESAQAAFVTEVLAAWKAAGARIPMLNWFALGDFTPELCATLSSYYSLGGDQNFAAYLCTLGLRRVDGVAKPSWQAFLDATKS